MKKIIRNLRTWLIHKLGGFTSDEIKECSSKRYLKGYSSAIHRLKQYSDSIYGITSDEWCKKMYNQIELLRKTFE